VSGGDRWVLVALQAILLGLPLFLGGRQTLAVSAAAVAVVGLLVVTLRERRRRGGPHAPGVTALAAFTALGLATTVPVPPAMLEWLAPATARLYGVALPGWPGGAEWSTWRSLALEPYAAWVQVTRLSVGLGVFAVIVAYPWSDDERTRVTGRLVLTLLGGGVLLAALALLEQVAGNGSVLWVTDVPAAAGRASGPFVNPNHFAAWLEMILPVALAYAVALYRRIHRRLRAAAEAARGIGVSARRARVAVLVGSQRVLWAPLAAGAAVLLMAVAHLATGSRGGTAALSVGLGVAGAGMLARVPVRTARRTVRRWLPLALACAFLVLGALSVGGWMRSGDALDDGGVDGADVSLASRIAVSTTGWQVVRDAPLFGTGLGSWVHAFRPYIEPSIAGGIWNHAHNDFLELTAETGLTGAALVLFFALAVGGAVRRGGEGLEGAGPRRDRQPGFRAPDWAAALDDTSRLRWGLAGGVAAILVHSAVDFSLRLPGNLVLAMVVLAVLVLTGRRQPARPAPALVLLPVLLVVPLLPQATNAVLVAAGGTPIAPRDCLDAADRLLAEEGESAQAEAVALVRRALDRSPADVDAHQALAQALGDGPEADEALRRALVLHPSATELRDQLGLGLLARGEEAAGTAELEESMYRFPALVSHAYLSPDLDFEVDDAGRVIQALADGDALAVRLVALEPPVVAAIERGLARAAEEVGAGAERAAIVSDQVLLLEARERWEDAATVLGAAADLEPTDHASLARAARNHLKARNEDAAEEALLGAVLRAPGEGDLYRDLAVRIYAARGDFPMAERVLEAGERNAVDLLPVYDGRDEVLRRRESARRADYDLDPMAPERATPEPVP
jgi:hypothetical protein